MALCSSMLAAPFPPLTRRRPYNPCQDTAIRTRSCALAWYLPSPIESGSSYPLLPKPSVVSSPSIAFAPPLAPVVPCASNQRQRESSVLPNGPYFFGKPPRPASASYASVPAARRPASGRAAFRGLLPAQHAFDDRRHHRRLGRPTSLAWQVFAENVVLFTIVEQTDCGAVRGALCLAQGWQETGGRECRPYKKPDGC